MSDDVQEDARPRSSDPDRFYVQLDKHGLFQALGKDDASSVFATLKDAFVFAAAVGWAEDRRLPLVRRQHVGFWRSFDARSDVPILQAIAISVTKDPGVVADQGMILWIAQEYANGGIDLIVQYDRSDRDRTLVALAGLVTGIGTETQVPRARGGDQRSDTRRVT